jgi:uncharacterized membrane protein
MDFQTYKMLGGIGALLLLLGCVAFFSPAAGGLLGLIGLILILVALNGFSDHYKERGIFNNALYSIILLIVGIVITIGITIFVALNFLASLGLDLADWQSFQTVDWAGLMTPDKIMELAGNMIIALVVLFVFFILTAIFLRKSLDLLGDKTGVKMFGTTGLIFLIGAVLTIVFIGFIIIFVAIILLMISFFSIKIPGPVPEPPQEKS